MLTSTSHPSEMEVLIAAHRAAVAAVGRLRDDVSDSELGAVVSTETAAVLAILKARCSSDDEFFVMAAHLLAEGIRTAGDPDPDNGFGALAIAVSTWLAERKRKH